MRFYQITEARAGRKYYVRFGDLPEGGRSAIGASANRFSHMRRRGDHELGVSCYNAEFSAQMQKWELDVNNYATLQSLLVSGRPIYLVVGDHVIDPEYEEPAYGQDQEPLLQNCKVVKHIGLKDLWVPGWGAEGEDLEDYVRVVTDLTEDAYEAGREFWNEVSPHYEGTTPEWAPEIPQWPLTPQQMREVERAIFQRPEWIAFWARFDWRDWHMARKWWFDKNKNVFTFYEVPHINYFVDHPHWKKAMPHRSMISLTLDGKLIEKKDGYSDAYMVLPTALEACRAVVRAAAPKLDWLQGTYFIRFGKWPVDERSVNFLSDKDQDGNHSKEKGVSVFNASYDLQDDRWELGADVDEAAISGTMGSLMAGHRPRYLVQGTELRATGADGEPLLRNVKLICELPRDMVYCPGIFDPREDD